MITRSSTRRIALLDRDGTIIVDKDYLSDPDGIEFAPGAIEGLRLLRDAGFEFVLITNQSGIARGYFDEATLTRVHDRLKALLSAEGLRLEAIYFCPHGPNDGCDCRKPAPGMVLSAMRDLRFRPDQAVLIGDSLSDMGAAVAAGVRALLIASIGEPVVGAAANFLEAAQRACALFSAHENEQLASM